MPELTGKLDTSVNGPEGLPLFDGDAWERGDWRGQRGAVPRGGARLPGRDRVAVQYLAREIRAGVDSGRGSGGRIRQDQPRAPAGNARRFPRAGYDRRVVEGGGFRGRKRVRAD